MTTYPSAAGRERTGRTEQADLRLLRAQRRAAERARELAELLAVRPELRGAYAPADLAVDSVCWGV